MQDFAGPRIKSVDDALEIYSLKGPGILMAHALSITTIEHLLRRFNDVKVVQHPDSISRVTDAIETPLPAQVL